MAKIGSVQGYFQESFLALLIIFIKRLQFEIAFNIPQNLYRRLINRIGVGKRERFIRFWFATFYCEKIAVLGVTGVQLFLSSILVIALKEVFVRGVVPAG